MDTDVVILKRVEDLLGSIPTDLQPIALSDVECKTCTRQRYIKGKVHTRWPLHTTRGRQLMKLLLTSSDGSDDQKANVFLTDDYARRCDCVIKGDMMCLSNIDLERATSSSLAKHPCNILVDPARTKARIWVVQCGLGVRPDLTNAQNQVPGQRVYSYTPLKDIQCGTTVNVYGVIRFFKPISKTRRDYMTMLSITDSSLGIHEKLKCILFARSPDDLPQINAVGDIVRFHRLKVQEFNGALQGQNGPGFTWLVFEGSPCKMFDHKTSSISYTITEKEKDQVTELREWWDSEDLVPSSCQTSHEKCLRDLDIDQYFDLTCQVVATCLLQPGVCMLLKVWDGTHSAIPIYEVDTRTEGKTVSYHKELMHITQDYVVDVCVFEDHFNTAILIKPGDFVKFVNLHTFVQRHKPRGGESHNAIPAAELCLHRGTSFGRGLQRIASDAIEIEQLKKRLELIAEQIQQNQPQDESEFMCVQVDRDLTSTVDPYQTTQISLLELSTSPLDEESLPPPVPRPSTTTADTTRQPKGNHSSGAGASGQRKRPHIEIINEGGGTASAESSEIARCMLQTATVITSHHHIKRTLLRDVLTHSAPYKFRVQAQVLDYQPKADTAEEFLRLYCPCCNYLSSIPGNPLSNSPDDSHEQAEEGPLMARSQSGSSQADAAASGLKIYKCPECSQKSKTNCQIDEASVNLNYIYVLKFLLDDQTGWLVGQLWKEQAELFFNGIAPKDVLRDKATFEHIQQKLKQLCFNPGRSVHKPLLECCIKSYTTSTGIHYQLFDTELTLEES